MLQCVRHPSCPAPRLSGSADAAQPMRASLRAASFTPFSRSQRAACGHMPGASHSVGASRQLQRCGRVAHAPRCQAGVGDTSLPPARPPQLDEKSSRSNLWAVAFAVAAAGAAYLLHQQGYLAVAKEYFAKTQVGRSGFPAAFSLIFLSELGDKTFFIAALLAAKFGRWLSFSASVLSLSVMTIISVAIGQSFRHVPEFLKSGLPIGEWASVALLVYFGVRTLKDAWESQDGETGEELVGAKDSVDAAEASGKISGTTAWQAFVQVATLIFLAEWGDRSMLATIVLAVSQSPVGVATGAIVGHGVATLIAVLGGAFASKHLSEKTIGYVGGTLFLAFAAATLLGVY